MIDIYSKLQINPEIDIKIKEIEKALGFKLFVWQKTFIAYGEFRQYGATTAYILRELLEIDSEPLDFSKKPNTKMESFYRRELRDIKEKLDINGIPTRTVFFNMQDKEMYKKQSYNSYRRYL